MSKWVLTRWGKGLLLHVIGKEIHHCFPIGAFLSEFTGSHLMETLTLPSLDIGILLDDDVLFLFFPLILVLVLVQNWVLKRWLRLRALLRTLLLLHNVLDGAIVRIAAVALGLLLSVSLIYFSGVPVHLLLS